MSQPKPTTRQQRELRRLAQLTGTSFAPPRTRAQASREISRLRKLRPSHRGERRAEEGEVRRAVGAGDATAYRREEIAGYGSTARWRGGRSPTPPARS